MSGFEVLNFSPSQARRALGDAADELRRQQAIHESTPPALAAAAAGRGFTEHGARLQQALERLHTAGALTIARTIDAIAHTHREVDRVAAADAANASELGGTPW